MFDIKPLQNLSELDSSISFENLKADIVSINLEGTFKLQTAIISKDYELLELNIDKQEDFIIASFYDEIIIDTPEYYQYCKIKN